MNLDELREAIVNGDAKSAPFIVKEALEQGVEPMALVTGCMIPAMDEVGRRFECEEFFVPELLLSGRAMKSAMELIRPLLAAKGTPPAGRVVIGTVKGDLHDIGKNLVVSMLEGGGFDVVDLGADVPPDRFVAAVRENDVDIVCLSALLTVTMREMEATIEALKKAGVRDRVKVLVGGAPLSAGFAKQIGADAYGENANQAVTVARQLVAIQKTA